MNNRIVVLPSHNECTGCGACIQACPKSCISFVKDDLDAIYPRIENEQCVKCGICLQVCHLNKSFYYQKAETVYAGWSNNEEVRKNSASGGIASSLYLYALKHGYKAFGVCISSQGKAEFIEIESTSDLIKVQNSKYVFSHTNQVYKDIREYTLQGKKVLFIGLPCQVAGLLSFLGKRPDNLFVVDIICHGTCPETYLQQHVDAISKDKKADRILFRDPSFGTNKFIFALYEQEHRFYSSVVHGTDVYQLGYHEALIYRENCYNCRYARPNRVGDITISDFSGLGKIDSWDLPRGNISCVIRSSEKGKLLLDLLREEKHITLFSRNPEEAFKYEKQLLGPSTPHPLREVFKRKYIATHQFEKVSAEVLREEIKTNRIRIILKKDEITDLIRKIIPKGIKKQLKKLAKTKNSITS